MNNIILTCVLTLIVSCVTWLNIHNDIVDQQRRVKILFKTTMISGAFIFAALYFLNGSLEDEVIEHMIKTPANF